MAGYNNISKGNSFMSLMWSDFDEQYLTDFPGTHFVGLERNEVERSGQNFSLVARGEPSQRGQLGFHQPIPRAQQIISPNNKNVGSSRSSIITNSHQSLLPWTFESGSTSSNNESGSNSIDIHQLGATDLLMAVSISTEENAAKITKLALEAMEDLRRVAMEPGEPLWKFDLDKNTHTLNSAEYARNFGNQKALTMEIDKLVRANFDHLPRLWPKNYCGKFQCDEFFESLITDNDLLASDHNRSPEDNLYSEGSREISYVGMKPLELVELLMDLEKWSQVFSDIVSKTTMLGVLASSGVQKDYEETLQVLRAEFQFPSPLVPTRESFMARYCKRLDGGLWGIADVSLEGVFQFPSSKHFRRRPSGCLIEQMPNGSSKVIWVENVAVDYSKVHGVFQQMVSSGFAFGAKRWVETVTRQCERSSFPTATINPRANAVLVTKIGRRNVLKLSERMVRNFFRNINASATNKWTPILQSMSSGELDPRLMATKTLSKNDDDPAKPSSIITYFTTSLGLQTPPRKLFDYLRGLNTRPTWDIMCFDQHSINEIVRIKTGEDPGNYVSLIQVKSTPDNVAILYLQESYASSTGSYVVYSALEFWAVSAALDGSVDPEAVTIVPSGLAVQPDVSAMSRGVARGSLLTVALHLADSEAPQEDSLDLMNNVLTDTVISIKNALVPNYMVLLNRNE